ncbi:hypothetical protein CANCADRAFT_130429 [Tortispora caseinolytica NRRL Y-17796]|uniref:Cytochrome b5 heme-binding domain-containing protein n=1 Tax=Tortispora caseinolytica NRRL Y-17796 TaxID=767744 RepID=A0A1E4TAX5_9ASCO|nr:hypothetical protein CANCADRAFT_130429 [Tortispora caseinolytica NRRL Y-17796]
MSREITLEEVAQHDSKDSLWLVVRGKVIDATKFLDDHPGGVEVIYDVAGQDATESYEDIGHSSEADAMLRDMEIGILKDTGVPAASKSSKSASTASASSASSGSTSAMPYLAIAAALAAFAFYYLNVIQS